MGTFFRRLTLLIVGILLLITPTIVRDNFWQYNARPYSPPVVPTLAMAVTPQPTAVPIPVAARSNETRGEGEFRAGPVLLDLAHYNSINPSALQPLADALASQGLGLRYWLSTVDALSVVNYLEYPDQSEALAVELADASALIIISPFFLWTAEEIALVQKFVANGGRLLLISDPDISGDYAAATNMIGEPFGVVFNEDYLYDTTRNDGNYTFFFQEAVAGASQEAAAPLADSTIAFYGGRSLSGNLQPVLQSIETTLSSLQVGRNQFTTAAVAGLAESGTAGRVLALSDLDVLTEPYRQRYDNQQLVDYVAEFLSADQRIKRVVDFPDYLGKEVGLAFGASAAINADLIMQGAQIQSALETSGRTLTLTDSTQLTNTTTASVRTAESDTSRDLIYLADYTVAMSQTTILDDLGIALYREVVTKTVPIATPPAQVTTTEPTKAAESESAASSEEVEEAPTEEATEEADEEATEEPDDRRPLATLTPAPTLTTTTPFTATGTLTETIEPTDSQRTSMAAVTATVTATVTTTRTTPINATPTPTPTAADETDREIAITATATVTAAVTATVTATATVSETTPISATVMPTETAAAAFEVRTVITTYLKLPSGLTFLAEETVLIVQQKQANERTLLAVLAANNRGIDTGVRRLLENDFSGCVIGDPLTFCALEKTSSSNEGNGNSSGSSSGSDRPSDGSSGNESPSEEPTPDEGDSPPRGANAPILLIDDNGAAGPTELSEADIYLQILIAGGYQVDLWSIGDQGEPTVDDLMAYGWVIWSNGGYIDGEIDGRDLETFFSYINQNGRITVSSRVPLPGLEQSAPLSDLVSEETIPALVAGLPAQPMAISGSETTAAVLSALAEEDEATQVVLRRGPESEESDAPALVVLADPSSGDHEARLMIAAFSIAWLPATEQGTLINNMATWMLTP